MVRPRGAVTCMSDNNRGDGADVVVAVVVREVEVLASEDAGDVGKRGVVVVVVV